MTVTGLPKECKWAVVDDSGDDVADVYVFEHFQQAAEFQAWLRKTGSRVTFVVPVTPTPTNWKG